MGVKKQCTFHSSSRSHWKMCSRATSASSHISANFSCFFISPASRSCFGFEFSAYKNKQMFFSSKISYLLTKPLWSLCPDYSMRRLSIVECLATVSVFYNPNEFLTKYRFSKISRICFGDTFSSLFNRPSLILFLFSCSSTSSSKCCPKLLMCL
jgi:hypothetical protein